MRQQCDPKDVNSASSEVINPSLQANKGTYAILSRHNDQVAYLYVSSTLGSRRFGEECAVCPFYYFEVGPIRKKNDPDLARRIQMTKLILDSDTPLYTLPELAAHLVSLIQYFKCHKKYIVETGLPPALFPDSPWLCRRLGRLYPTRETFSQVPASKAKPT